MHLSIWAEKICFKNQDGGDMSFRTFRSQNLRIFIDIASSFSSMAIATLVSCNWGIVAMCGMTDGLQDLLLISIVFFLFGL
jgi:hypothetical protein